MALKSVIARAAKKRKAKDETLTRIHSYLKTEYNRPLPYTPKPAHKPSYLGTNCFRQMYYNYYCVEKDTGIDPKGAKIFSMGDAVEDMVMGWLKKMGEHIPYRDPKTGEIPTGKRDGKPNPQFPITIPEWRIRKGFIDNVWVDSGKLWLYEIKSMASWKFQELEEPKPEHQIQGGCYVKAVPQHLAQGDYAHIPELAGIDSVEGVRYLYVNKDNTDIKVYDWKAEQFDAVNLETDVRLEVANQYIDAFELPPKTEDNCRYCPFKKKCKDDWNELPF